MENASKALIMAAGVLLGVMIISIGVYLFSVYGEYSSSMYKRMDDAQIEQFNSQFLKFYGSRTSNDGKKQEVITCTIHDIISLASLARQNNINYEIQNDVKNATENTHYIQIDIKGSNQTKNIERYTESQLLNLLQNNATTEVNVIDEEGNPKKEKQAKYYKCTEVKISSITKRVYYMQFDQI